MVYTNKLILDSGYSGETLAVCVYECALKLVHLALCVYSRRFATFSRVQNNAGCISPKSLTRFSNFKNKLCIRDELNKYLPHS